MKGFVAALLLITLPHSGALSPTDCKAAEPVAEKVLDLINKGRRDGYIFQLLRVADAHLDKVEPTVVYYLALDISETDCPVLSRKHWNDCNPEASRRPSEIVIGHCKVIATAQSNESLDLRVNDFNCTTSSVSSALANTKDSPVLLDFFEDTEPYRKLANKALEKYKTEHDDFTFFRVDRVERVSRVRGGERTGYYVDFSVRNCSRHHSPRHPTVFGFCKANLVYDIEASDLETPSYLDVNCDSFNFEEQRNVSGGQQHPGHSLDSGSHEHPPAGRHPFKPKKFRDHSHHHQPLELGCPPPLGGKGDPESGAAPPRLGSRCQQCHQLVFENSQTHGPSHNHSEHHGHHPHGHHPHGHRSHGHQPHGHHPHGHHPHGHRPHGHRPHGHHPHRKHPHGQHSQGDDFHDHSPCDPPPHSQGPHDHQPRGSPQKQSKEKHPGKRHFAFHWGKIGYVYRLPPLNKGEVLPLPEANFPRCSNHPLKPEIQPFPQSASESCPGKLSDEFLHIQTFFENIAPK